MNISSVSTISVSSLTTTQAVQPNGQADADGNGDGHRMHHGHGHGGGGAMGKAVMEAFQSLGISMPAPPQPGQGAAPGGSDPSTDSNSGRDDASSSPMKKVGADMRNFMHALFQAVKGESASGSDSTGGDASQSGSMGNSAGSFASGLSALISQVSNGSAPADLQSAFDQLKTDMQSAAGGSSETTSGNASPDGSGVDLQAFLSKLQAGLGYGASTLPQTGNLVSSSA